jgi:hypothetical protein
MAKESRRPVMKSLGELEVYHDPMRGVRMPMSSGRRMLVDQLLRLAL